MQIVSFRSLIRCAAALAVVILVALAGVASAGPAGGKWKGKVQGIYGVVTFKVSSNGKKLVHFRMKGGYGTLHCGSTLGETITSTTITFASAKIKGNKVSATHTRTAAGATYRDRLNIRFSGRTAKGSVREDVFNGPTVSSPEECSSGTLKFKAHRA